MQPRILFRTHYQVDEPAYMEFLVKLCTSPVRSAYNETVAQKLTREIQGRGKDFNVAAGVYALDLARGLGLVNEQNVWTEKGHLVNLVAEVRDGTWEELLDLSARERLLHFRLFLEADGAAFLFIARKLLDQGRIPNSQDDWNSLAKSLFLETFSEYLKMTGTTADRVALRAEIDRIRSKGYAGKSGPHKMFIHVQTLHRLGLVDRTACSTAREYRLPGGSDTAGLRRLMAEIPDLYLLESIIKEHGWPEVAAKVFEIGGGTERAGWNHDDLLGLLVPAYHRVMLTGVPLCPLGTLVEAVQIELLAQRSELMQYAIALELLRSAQKERMRDIRFHVDRSGAPAFLKLSDELVASYSSVAG